jgi:hypothetical protein
MLNEWKKKISVTHIIISYRLNKKKVKALQYSSFFWTIFSY